MYAFWKYDIFPYLLGGEVDTEKPFRQDVNGGDLVFIKSYRGWFRPEFLIEDDETAKLLMKELDTISSERNAEMEKLKRKFSRKISKFETKMKGISK